MCSRRLSSSSDLAGGGARFTRLRAVMSAEGNAVVGRIIAEIFDDTTNAFIEAIEQSLPHLPRTTIVWRCSFCSVRCTTPWSARSGSRGCPAAQADGADMAQAIEQLVSATVASLQAPDIGDLQGAAKLSPRRARPDTGSAKAVQRRRPKKIAAD